MNESSITEEYICCIFNCAIYASLPTHSRGEERRGEERGGEQRRGEGWSHWGKPRDEEPTSPLKDCETKEIITTSSK